MTNEEAIKVLQSLIPTPTRGDARSTENMKISIALLMAIKALEQEKTAEWIKQKSGDELFPEEIVCSKCYHSNSHLDFDEHNNPIGKVFLESKYCPNCGAKNGGRKARKKNDTN